MKKIILVAVILLVSQLSFSQKKVITNTISSPIATSCNCSDLEIYPYFYYQDPDLPNASSMFLRFDFHHKGKLKCKPEFLGNITISKSDGISVTIPVSRLTSYVNTENQRIFVVTQQHLLGTLRPMIVGTNYKITYSLGYGTKSVCPKTSTKNVVFEKSEPIL